MNNNSAERILRGVLIANGLGDIGLAALMIVFPGLLTRLLGLRLTDDLAYVAGGWGTAAASFGAMRLYAGWKANSDVRWFVGAFGIVESAVLTVFSLATTALTSLTFRQVWLSAFFAAAFGSGYGVAFLRRRRQVSGRPGSGSPTRAPVAS